MKNQTIRTRLAALCLATLLCLATALPAAASPAATRDAGPVSYLADWVQSIYATIAYAVIGGEPEPGDEAGPLIIVNSSNVPEDPDTESGPLMIPNGLTSEDSETESSGVLIIPNG